MTTSPTRPQPDPEQRRHIEELVSVLPGRSDHQKFDEPWEVRAFAIVVAAHTSGQYPWSDFQQALIDSIKGWEESAGATGDPSWSYYEHWVNALEAVLDRRGAVDPAAVELRTREVLAAPPSRNHHDPHYEPVAVHAAVRS
ncbi:nitrile hydratase accessory protein [Nocardioides pocheonensis]|uniref:Nitrile hydratase accessory protein n=1 Tax=Nocardioides pocheonensis TaxID=661485 RepID=A0A3N0GGV8_9ACTN|nr:nitrile hydratase accessory protein [Nocardioides pocheonensis]RNM11704.1 nitrile hydratase accessory protein [Nocardioides pocheonensis]